MKPVLPFKPDQRETVCVLGAVKLREANLLV